MPALNFTKLVVVEHEKDIIWFWGEALPCLYSAFFLPFDSLWTLSICEDNRSWCHVILARILRREDSGIKRVGHPHSFCGYQ